MLWYALSPFGSCKKMQWKHPNGSAEAEFLGPIQEKAEHEEELVFLLTARGPYLPEEVFEKTKKPNGRI